MPRFIPQNILSENQGKEDMRVTSVTIKPNNLHLKSLFFLPTTLDQVGLKVEISKKKCFHQETQSQFW